MYYAVVWNEKSNMYLTPNPSLLLAQGACLALVDDVQDPQKLGRVQIRLLTADGIGDHAGPMWARVAVPVAGDNRGAFLIPDVGDEVLVLFIQGDTRLPIVVGSLWNGKTAIPEALPGDKVDRWSFTGKNGTKIAIVEAEDGQEEITLTTPQGVRARLTDEAGGKIEIESAPSKITLDTSGIKIETTSKVSVQGNAVDVQASSVKVTAPMTTFTGGGVVKCEALITNSVVSKTYSQGAGNLW
jgi:uncharacterized protein involved in type VI secretion and phage assembly